MRLSAQEDIELGRDAAFRHIVDPGFFERQLMRRAIDFVRIDAPDKAAQNATWRGDLPISGQRREVTGRFTRWSPPESAVFEAVSGGLAAEVHTQFIVLSVEATRLHVTLDLTADRLRDRLLLQTLQITKPRLSGKFAEYVAGFARNAVQRATEA